LGDEKQGMSQEHLNALYTDFRSEAEVDDALASRLSSPLLLAVGANWERSKHRLVFIGQETLGWDFRAGSYYAWPYPPIESLADFLRFECAVTALVDGYRAFNFAKHQPSNYRSPFWHAFRQFCNRAESTGSGAVLWSNLFRCSLDSGSVVNNATDAESTSLLRLQHGVLLREISILQPTSVVFVTGPSYDFAIDHEFEGMAWEKWSSYNQRQLAKLSHPVLPARTFRTYHPGYLARDEERWKWLAALEDEVFQ
jgi:hypothetical protein